MDRSPRMSIRCPRRRHFDGCRWKGLLRGSQKSREISSLQTNRRNKYHRYSLLIHLSLITCRSRWTNAALHTKPFNPSSIQYLHRTQHPRNPRPLQLPPLRRRTRNTRLPLPKLHLNPPHRRHPPHNGPKSHLRRRNIRSLHTRPHRTPTPDPRIYRITLHNNRSPRRLHNQQNQGIQLPDHEYLGTNSRCPAM